MLNNEELLTKLVEAEERSKSNTHRLNHMEKEYGELGRSINRMATAVEVLATEQKQSTDEQRKMRETMTETADRVASLELSPSKHAKKIRDEIIKQSIGVIVGTLLGAVLALILK
ncbi:MAG: hypothetical protein IJW69_01515 [Clostridia bacterium]|nr:hypothetical protein [Clostridia bacterium]